jgi:maleate cis-trans isomerase
VSRRFKPILRIGYISPHPLVDTLPYEFYLMAPPGVMMMSASLEIEDYTLDAVERQLAVLDSRISSLMARGAQRVILSGVPIALALGRRRMLATLSELSARWGVPADTDLEAIIAGIQRLGAKKVGLATRWSKSMNDALAHYLSEAGLETVSVANSARSMAENAKLDDETGMQLAVDLASQVLDDQPATEAVIMPGGRWITIDAVAELEARYGKPVITNYSAGLWAALRDTDLRAVEGRGMLLATLGGQ